MKRLLVLLLAVVVAACTPTRVIVEPLVPGQPAAVYSTRPSLPGVRLEVPALPAVASTGHKIGSNYQSLVAPSSIVPSSSSGYILTTVTGGSSPTWQPNAGAVTWAGDLIGSTSSSQTVASAQSGSISFSSTGQIACFTGASGCQFKQSTKASDSAPNAMSIQAQSAYASATGTNNNGGALTLASGSPGSTNGTAGPVTALLAPPTGTGTESAFFVDRGTVTGTHVAALGAYPTNPAYGALWFGPTKGATNWGQIGDGATFTQINAPTTSSTIYFSAGGSPVAVLSPSGLTLGVSAALGGGVGGTFGITSGTTSVTAGVSTGSIIQSYSNNLNLWAPWATNLAGNVNVQLGATGTGTIPLFQVYQGGSVQAALGHYSTSYAGLYLNGASTPSFYGDGATSAYVSGSTNVGLLVSGGYSPIYAGSTYVELNGTTMNSSYGGTGVVNITNGTAMTSAPSGGATIQAISGALTVTAAGNTTPSATFGATTTTIAGTLDAGYVAVTPVNGANTLTAAQSAVANLNLLAGATAAVTVTDALTPAAAKGALLFVRNNTSQTVTFGWSTGTTITLATLTSALVTSDGTNAVKLMAGT